MRLEDFVRKFLTVHKCVGCGEVLGFDRSESAFCEKCWLSWTASLNASCETCLRSARECACMPPKLKASGALVHRKLFFYKKEGTDLPESKLIYAIKRQNHKRLSRFSADQLLPLIKQELAILDVDVSSLMVTNVPRGRSSVAKYGFDQSALIAKDIGKRLEVKYEPLFTTSIFSKVQKKLDAAGREHNANKSIRLNNGVEVCGKFVVLVDDVVTTGASMASCVRLLMKEGAGGVLCFSISSKSKGK